MIKTYVVMLSTDSNLTPSMLAERAATLGDIEFKETCYGLLLEGEEKRLEEVLGELRKLDPNKIFFKVRGYRIGDERICRAKRGGGPRAGYHMLSVEREALKNVSKALEAKELPVYKETPRAKLSPEELNKIISSECTQSKSPKGKTNGKQAGRKSNQER